MLHMIMAKNNASGGGKPRLLDLFSGAGGCTRGYQMAGFFVVGVDESPQPRYVGDEFIQADIMEWLPGAIESGYTDGFDLISASPPCQRYSSSTGLPNVDKESHPDLVGPVRDLLLESRKPYIIENVPGAPLVNPLLLCGTMFPGLRVIRHRLFECCPTVWFPPAQCCHWGKTAPIMWGDKKAAGIQKGDKTHMHLFDFVTVAGSNGLKGDYELAMNIDWMLHSELMEAIPPAYTHWLGEQMLKILELTP